MNNNIIRNVSVKVDMNRMNRAINTRATFNQRDVKTAVILCNLDMGGNINLSNCKVRAEILKPDGTKVITLCQILDEENGLVAVGLNNQCLSAIGEVRCELIVQSESQVLYSPVLIYNVIDNLFDLDNEAITSQNEYPVLSQLIVQVQNVENDLEALELIIETNELDRNNNEEIRKNNEQLRQEYLEKIKEDLIEINDIFEDKLQMISSEIDRLNTEVLNSISDIDEAITEVEKISNSIISLFNNKLEDINEHLQMYDVKINEINQTIENCTSITNENIRKMTESTNNFITNIQNTVDESINNSNITIDRKIKELEKTSSDTITNINNTMSENYNQVNDKCVEVTNKINEVNSIISNVEINESNRIQAEKDREDNYNRLVSTFKLTESDITDIMSMIGGI